MDRLWIKQEIPFALAEGGLVLYVGMSVDDYLADWRRTSLLTLFACAMLLVGWIWSLRVFRHDAHSRAQLMTTVEMMHAVLESTAVPVVVVSQTTG